MKPSLEERIEGNNGELRNKDHGSWFDLAAGSVPAVSSFSSLSYREDVCGGPLGSKISCPHLSIAVLITALTKL